MMNTCIHLHIFYFLMYCTVQYTKQQHKYSAPASRLWSGTIRESHQHHRLYWSYPGSGGENPLACLIQPWHASTEMSSKASSIPSSLCPTKIEVLITVTVTHHFYKNGSRQKLYLYVRQFDACVVTEYSTQKLHWGTPTCFPP